MKRIALSRFPSALRWTLLAAALCLTTCLLNMSSTAFGTEAPAAGADASQDDAEAPAVETEAPRDDAAVLPIAAEALAGAQQPSATSAQSSPVLNLYHGTIYLRSQESALQYSQDKATWTDYTGAITVQGRSAENEDVSFGGHIEVLSGEHSLVFDGLAINVNHGKNAALIIRPGASLSIELKAKSSLEASDTPAIQVDEGAHLEFQGGGSLSATSSSSKEAGAAAIGAAAIGAAAGQDSLGTIEFNHTGTIEAYSFLGTTLGCSLGDAPASSGRIVFRSGTVQLYSGRTTTNMNALTMEVSGGNIELSNPQPDLFPIGLSSPEEKLAHVKITGLPAGYDLTKASLFVSDRKIREEGFFSNTPGSDQTASKWYCVGGFNPVAKDKVLNLFLKGSDLKHEALLSFRTASKDYSGRLYRSSETGEYEVTVHPSDGVVASPIFDLETMQRSLMLDSNNLNGSTHFSLDGGSTWKQYSGSVIVKGESKEALEGDAIVVRGGTHTIRLESCTLKRKPSRSCISLELGANVELVLSGRNQLGPDIRDTGTSPSIRVREGATLTIDGEGSLSAEGDENAAGIGCNEGEFGGTIAIKGGTVVTEGGSCAPGLGAGWNGRMKSILIEGGCSSIRSNSGWHGAIDAGEGGEVRISGGTVYYSSPYLTSFESALSARGVRVTGGTLHWGYRSAKTALARSWPSDAPATSLAAEPLALASAGEPSDEEEPVHVNEQGTPVFPVEFYGLPEKTPLSDFHLRILDTDFVDDPAEPSDYGVKDVETSPRGTLTFYLTAEEAKDKLVVASWNGRTYMATMEPAPAEGKGYQCGLEPAEAALYYEGHTLEQGWLFEDAGTPWSFDGTTSGAPDGDALTALRFETPVAGLTVAYRADNGAGWSEPSENGDIAGEMADPLQGVRIGLSGEQAESYEVHYRVYVEGIGWMGWAKNDEPAGTAGYGASVKAVQAAVTPTGAGAPESDPSDVEQAHLVAGEKPAPEEKPAGSNGNDQAAAKPLGGDAALARTGDPVAYGACAALALAVAGTFLAALAAARKRSGSSS